MKYVALTLVAVLAMVGAASAQTIDIGGGASAVITEQVLDFGLSAYNVHMFGAKSFEDLKVLGTVHQVFLTGGLETPYAGMVPGALAPPQNAAPYDTAFLFAQSAITVGTAAQGAIETSTGGNERGLTADYTMYAGVAPVNFPGMGTFDTQGLAFTFSGDLKPEGYALLNVVVATGTTVTLEGLFVGSEGLASMSVPVGGTVIPEPGTIMLLLTGVLCLAGIRRR